MIREEMVQLIKAYPYVKFTHYLFSEDEFIFSRDDGFIYDEKGYLFENWELFSANNGIRRRVGGQWEDGWAIKNDICKYQCIIPSIGICCAYDLKKDEHGYIFMPQCEEDNCEVRYPRIGFPKTNIK